MISYIRWANTKHRIKFIKTFEQIWKEKCLSLRKMDSWNRLEILVKNSTWIMIHFYTPAECICFVNKIKFWLKGVLSCFIAFSCYNERVICHTNYLNVFVDGYCLLFRCYLLASLTIKKRIENDIFS